VKNGEWVGTLGHVVRGEDQIMSSASFHPQRAKVNQICTLKVIMVLKVVDPSLPIYSDLPYLASPIPRPYRSIFAVLRPFSAFLWLATMTGLLMMTIVLYILTNREEALIETTSSNWKSPADTFWFTFATFIGESILGSAQVSELWAMR